MPIFVWIYRITWIRDKTVFFSSFLFSCWIDIIVILKVHEHGQNFICILIFKCKTLGKQKVPLVKTLFQKCFCQTPQKKYMIKRVNLSFKIDFYSVELLELFMINKMFNFINGNWKINKMHLIRTNKSNESATERHAEISRLQINIEESNALTLKKNQPRKRQGIIKWKVLSYIF